MAEGLARTAQQRQIERGAGSKDDDHTTGAGMPVMDDGRLFSLIMLTSLVLWLMPAVIPLARSQHVWLTRAAVAVLATGFVIALVRILQWLITGVRGGSG